MLKYLLYNSGVLLLWIFQEKLKTYINKKSCIEMFTTAFLIAQAVNKPNVHQQKMDKPNYGLSV